MHDGTDTHHAARIEALARTAILTGVNLQPGQQLILTAPLAALDLSRALTRQAYAAGASMVTTLYADDADTLARFELAPDGAFDASTPWLFEGMAKAYEGGAARLAISGDDPSLLAGQDPGRVARANRSRSAAYQPIISHLTEFRTNWCIVSSATPAWAKAVFPDLPPDGALARLWDAVFSASRIDTPDPVAAWREHNAGLVARREALNGLRFSALRFRGPGTDLVVGLADDHEWGGGPTVTRSGITCNANLPTEEVYTTPHCRRVEGHVSASRPLAYKGTLIRDIRVRFEAGVAVEATSSTGSDVLGRMLDTDEGSRRLGEVALVPASSAISASGLLFYNTLYDENAASHIAMGQSYAKCFRDGGRDLDREALSARGANHSMNHVDWMIGSPETDVDGIAADGSSVPVMRYGEWA